MRKHVETQTNSILNYKSILDSSDYVLIQQEMPIETTYSIITYCFENDIKVILNPAPAVELKKDIFEKIYLLYRREVKNALVRGNRREDH